MPMKPKLKCFYQNLIEFYLIGFRSFWSNQLLDKIVDEDSLAVGSVTVQGHELTTQDAFQAKSRANIPH